MDLSILIPQSPDQLLEDCKEKDLDNFLINIKSTQSRSIIFFDESLEGYIIYKSDQIIPDDFHDVAYLNVSILPSELNDEKPEVVPKDKVTDDELSTNDLDNGNLTSNNYSVLNTPLSSDQVVLRGSNSVDDFHYIIWKFEIPMVYPRKKFDDPNILFCASFDKHSKATLCNDNKDLSRSQSPIASLSPSLPSPTDACILQDYIPGDERNLFSELNNQVSLPNDDDSKNYYLSDSFIKKKSVQHNGNRKYGDLSLSTDYADKLLPIPKLNLNEKTSIDQSILRASVRLPITISLVIKLKSTKPAGRNNILLATLNIESSEELLKYLKICSNDSTYDNYYFKITNLSMVFKYGLIEEFKSDKYDFPIQYKLLDSINLTYKLINNEFLDKELKHGENSNSANNNNGFSTGTNSINSSSKPVGISLQLQVLKFVPLTNSFINASNLITTNWSPSLDFSIIAPPINNSLKTTTNYSQSQFQPKFNSNTNSNYTNGMTPRKSAIINSMYRTKSTGGVMSSNNLNNNNNHYINNNSRKVTSPMVSQTSLCPSPIIPSSSITTSNTVTSFNVSNTKKINKPLSSASSVTVNLTTNNNSTLSGLKLTFKGNLNINLGEIVTWKLQAINNSHNKLDLSLIVQNPINFNPIYSTSTNSNNVNSNNFSSSNLLNTDYNEENSNKDILVYNKLQLHTLYSSLKLDTNGVIILDNDIRIGPIEPNSVFETDIKLIGLSKGIFNLDGIKIFDINSGDGIDFGKLVEVFVV